MPHESRPAWAQRLTAERLARGWTQQQTTEALRMQADRELPDPSHLRRMCYPQVIEAARAGRAMAPNDAVSVQLAGQEAKAWEDAMANMHAHEVIRKSTAPRWLPASPMRAAEAPPPLAVASDRADDLDGAIEAGTAALEIPRRSVPSLLMVTGDLVTELRQRYARQPGTSDYVERVSARATGGD